MLIRGSSVVPFPYNFQIIINDCIREEIRIIYSFILLWMCICSTFLTIHFKSLCIICINSIGTNWNSSMFLVYRFCDFSSVFKLENGYESGTKLGRLLVYVFIKHKFHLHLQGFSVVPCNVFGCPPRSPQ